MAQIAPLAPPLALPADSPDITAAEAAAMLRAALNLFRLWEVEDEQGRVLLGQPSPRPFARWKAGEISRLPHDVRQRLSYLMGIHKALRHMFKEPQRAYAWVKKPNLAFGGQSALQRMLAGDVTDLAAVRSYLDAERGGW